MIARGFKPVAWVAAIGTAALGCYMLSLRVASERAELAGLERRIVNTQKSIRSLQTELDTRGRVTQLQQWNDEILALAPPSAGQFLDSQMMLARFEVQPAPGDRESGRRSDGRRRGSGPRPPPRRRRRRSAPSPRRAAGRSRDRAARQPERAAGAPSRGPAHAPRAAPARPQRPRRRDEGRQPRRGPAPPRPNRRPAPRRAAPPRTAQPPHTATRAAPCSTSAPSATSAPRPAPNGGEERATDGDARRSDRTARPARPTAAGNGADLSPADAGDVPVRGRHLRDRRPARPSCNCSPTGRAPRSRSTRCCRRAATSSTATGCRWRGPSTAGRSAFTPGR